MSDSEINEDIFTEQNLADAFEKAGVSEKNGQRDEAWVQFLLLREPQAENLLRVNKLTFDAPMHDEGYVIVSRGPIAFVIAETTAGLFYGAQTVKQLIRGSGKDAVLLVPTIRDWPAMTRSSHDIEAHQNPPIQTFESQPRQTKSCPSPAQPQSTTEAALDGTDTDVHANELIRRT